MWRPPPERWFMLIPMKLRGAWFLVLGVMMLAPYAGAHFRLLEPQGWLVENNLGDPQKLGPCGGTSADPGTPTNALNRVQGGQMLHIKLQETIFHPGHYRVALAVNSRAELPPDPDVATRDTDKGPWSVSSPHCRPNEDSRPGRRPVCPHHPANQPL